MSPIMRKSMDNVNHSDPGPEDDVLEQVHAVMHLYRSQQYQVLREGLHDLTHMEGKVLGYFGRHAGATQSDLAQHSGRDKAQLARLVKGLRDRGLLACQADPADRRNQRLSLTADGQAVLRTLQQQARRLAVQAVAGMTAAEQQQLAALLQRVKANLGGRAP
jgi:DNA-binding MarR family transcriptional regulator